MIRRLYADNFRCLGNFELRPGQINLLLGGNGAGKSSLLDALRCVRDLVVHGFPAAQLFGSTKTIWDRRDVQSFELELEATGGIFSYRLEIQHAVGQLAGAQRPQIKSESLDLDAKPLFRYADGQVRLFDDDHSPGAQFPFKSERSFLPNLESQNGKLRAFKTFLAGINVFQLNPFALEPASQQDHPFLLSSGSNFASWLRYLSEERPRAKADCEERLAEIISGFQSFRFQTAGDRKSLLVDFAREAGEGYYLGLNHLSEGHRVLCLLYAIVYGLVGSASVLCFDEPENFISLPEVQPWLQCLRDLVEERAGQVLLISHHPEVIDYLAADTVFRFERPTGDLVRVGEWQPDPTKILRPSEILARER
ncbi:MAG: AAA family ATPase [Thermoanaerobaculia bacterium]|nr:AAA family ATPase [Thermoanaerobaculia bacterium]